MFKSATIPEMPRYRDTDGATARCYPRISIEYEDGMPRCVEVFSPAHSVITYNGIR